MIGKVSDIIFYHTSVSCETPMPIKVFLYLHYILLLLKVKSILCYNLNMKTILVDAVYGLVVEGENGFEVWKPLQELLEEFPNKKIILTGADDEQYKKFGLDNMPYEVFTLKHNPEKTDPEYYKIMLAHFNLSPEDVIYFEHSPEAVASAQSVGIKTFQWDDNTRPLAELKEFLKNNL